MRVLYYNDEDFNLKLNKSSNQIEGDFFNSSDKQAADVTDT